MEFSEGLKWIVGTLIAILGLFGVGKIWELKTNRKYALADRNSQIHETNEAKQIEYDAKFIETLVVRVGVLETKLEKMQDEQISLIKTNAALEADNKNLTKENERQESEIKKLRDDKNKQAEQIADLKEELHQTQAQVKLLTEQIENLSKFKQGEKS